MNRKHANAIKYIAKVAVLTAAAVIIMYIITSLFYFSNEKNTY